MPKNRVSRPCESTTTRRSVASGLTSHAELIASVTCCNASCTGDTVAAALASLIEQHPGLANHLRAKDGKLRSFVNVYLDDEDVRYLDGEDTAVPAGATLTIVPSIAGGWLA